MFKYFTVLIALLFLQDCDFQTSEHIEREYAPFDGVYNNIAAPLWGSAETPLIRRLSPQYSDGTYQPAGKSRPNPLDLSDQLMAGPTGFASGNGRTAFLTFFGQQVVEEILDSQRPGCPIEYFNIPIPKNHPFGIGGIKEFPFRRSRFQSSSGSGPSNPRQQLNEISSFIDGTLFYGPNKAWCDALRTLDGGLLKSIVDDGQEYPAINTVRLPMANPPPAGGNHKLEPVNRFWMLGNPRGNENPFLLSFGILWFRFHNEMAKNLKVRHPSWGDERLFNEARKWTIAVHQKIVVYDWLSDFLGQSFNNSNPYTEYNPAVHPGISNVFQSTAMRFGHTLVPPGVFVRDAGPNCSFKPTLLTNSGSNNDHAGDLRTCNTYFRPQEFVRKYTIDSIFRGMASQVAEREDNIITPDLRTHLFGPLEFYRRDLMALNVQRGRDHGLPDYNTARYELGLERKKTFSSVNPSLLIENSTLLENFKRLYDNNIDNVDIWVGGLLETTDNPGELFTAILIDQFKRLRDGDRFWYENKKNGLFTNEEINEINNNYTIKRVLLMTTSITEDEIQDNPFIAKINDTTLKCMQAFQLDENHFQNCTKFETYDYFKVSEGPFIVTFFFLGIFLVVCILILFFSNKIWEKIQDFRNRKNIKETLYETGEGEYEQQCRQKKILLFRGVEWVGFKEGTRKVYVELHKNTKTIQITKFSNPKIKLRILDLSHIRNLQQSTIIIRRSCVGLMNCILMKIPKESYDLIIYHQDAQETSDYINKYKKFIKDLEIKVEEHSLSEKAILRRAYTKQNRQNELDRFFKLLTANAFGNSKSTSNDSDNMIDKDIFEMSLSKAEFAESFGMKPSSLFVSLFFNILDDRHQGYISFNQMLDIFVEYSKGSEEDKLKIMFRIYDVDNKGKITKDQFKNIFRSQMEFNSFNDNNEDEINEKVEKMFASRQLQNSNELDFEQFKILITGQKNKSSTLNKQRNKSRKKRAEEKLNDLFDVDQEENSMIDINDDSQQYVNPKVQPMSKFDKLYTKIESFLNTYRYHVIWVTLYILVCLGIFAERAYYYSVEREHAGLRRIAGYGVTVTRGAASAMMFTYSTLLVTMCRNIITKLRETFLNRYVPFDSAVDFHKLVAYIALFFTVMHCIGHGINFYHISSQAATDLSCIFRNFFYATHILPTFTHWCWLTITGFSGVILALIVVVMFVFATSYARKNFFRLFWFTHNLYIFLFALMIIHGTGRLVQPPIFQNFFLGPAILYVIDKLISFGRKTININIVSTEILPSMVTKIEFKKPSNFEYLSGQWLRIALVASNGHEYHPFTITSAPFERNLSLHIRAVGPWTKNLRKVCETAKNNQHPLPEVYIDGPYGEGHQDWFRYQVSVLVGGGIGVTPFISILKDLANRMKSQSLVISCKKVYFLWITRTQKQFEWVIDIIRQIEEVDAKHLVEVHMFITEFKSNFDIRTNMMYICEKYFRKISGKSLFAGVRAVTHFGRPNFRALFDSLDTKHGVCENAKVGVFSCGPGPMTSSVEAACTSLTRNNRFLHHYENF